MTQWLQEYCIFRKNDCENMIQSHNETRAHITDDSASVQTLSSELEKIETIWSSHAQREAATVEVTPARSVGAKLTGRMETPEEAWHNEVSHDFVNNHHKLTWHANANTPCDFDTLIALRHEAEHANQSVGFGYTQDEKALIWIERACHLGQSENYWAQFGEMNARMKEAEFCIDLLTTHKSHLSVYDQQSIMHLAESVLRRLTYKTTEESLNALQQQQKEYLHKKILPAQYLNEAFPNAFLWQRNAAALDFLQHTAPKLYEDCYKRLQDVHERLSQYVAEWQQSIPNAVKRYEHQQENERLQELAIQYGIPVLTEMPESVHTMPIHGDSHAEQYIQQKQQQAYNVALVVFSNKPAQLIYDTERIPRPYSTSPSLQMQWQVANALPTIDVPEVPEVEHSDDERFD